MKTERPTASIRATVLVACIVCQPLGAQGLASEKPFARTGDILLSDSFSDVIWRLQDLNLDGDYNDSGEIMSFYTDTLGPYALSVNNHIAITPEGAAYVCDSSTDLILRMQDLDGNGDAQGPGETSIFFDGVANGSGVQMASAFSIMVDVQGVFWVAVTNTSSVGVDMVLRLEDMDFNGDANGPGEAKVYTSRPGGSVGDSIITDVAIGPDGHVYFVENGTAAGVKGVYRCDDMNLDGDAEDPGEVALYYQPAPQAGTPFHWGMAFDRDGTFYLTDSGNEIIWKARDDNGNNFIEVGTEDRIFFQVIGASSTMWRPNIASDGSVFAVEDSTPDGIWKLTDINMDGDASDPGEAVMVYSELSGAQPAIDAKGMALFRGPRLDFPDNPVAGANNMFTIEGALGDTFSLWFSTAAGPPFPVPPFGYLELNILPPNVFFPILNGILPSGGELAFPVPGGLFAPGTSFALQAVVGNAFRLQFTNAKAISFL